MADAEDPTLEFMGCELFLFVIYQGHSDRENQSWVVVSPWPNPLFCIGLLDVALTFNDAMLFRSTRWSLAGFQ